MSGLLWVEGVGYGFWRGGAWSGLLSDVSFEVEPGEIVALIGDRLAGKTTLLKIVAGLQRPTTGQVWFEGRSLWELGKRQREQLVGREIVWANRAIKPETTKVSKYVGMGLAVRGRRGDPDHLAAQALERVGASECANSLPRDLSLGQQTLVGIARGFAKHPRLLVMDELLDGLGTDASDEALGLLHELANSNPPCGVLLSASSMEPVTLADRVWSIHKQGLKLETGYTKITSLKSWHRGRSQSGGSP
jgi:ABC-type multidrug transport system ATPase subunit